MENTTGQAQRGKASRRKGEAEEGGTQTQPAAKEENSRVGTRQVVSPERHRWAGKKWEEVGRGRNEDRPVSCTSAGLF